MGKEKKDNEKNDLDLLELFSKAVVAQGNPESGEPGKVHFLVMPDKIIKTVRDRIMDIDRTLSQLETMLCRFESGIYDSGGLTQIQEAEYRIAQAERELAKYKKERRDESVITAAQQKLEGVKMNLDYKKNQYEQYKREKERLEAMRNRYEEMVLKILEAALK